jgi:hypothetical protein
VDESGPVSADKLAARPLFGFAILRLSASRLLWYQRYRHIANDCFGGWLLARRAAEIYTALANGENVSQNPFVPRLAPWRTNSNIEGQTTSIVIVNLRTSVLPVLWSRSGLLGLLLFH